jgi:glycylpeptide N-tetradecanoyltransferase
VEDDDNMFRFDYSPEFLKWALLPPGQYKEWIVGVRVIKTKKMVGFITGVPVHMILDNEHKIKMTEINFLCVYKKLRANRLAPVLIKEITRRVNRLDMWQAVYTAGV